MSDIVVCAVDRNVLADRLVCTHKLQTKDELEQHSRKNHKRNLKLRVHKSIIQNQNYTFDFIHTYSHIIQCEKEQL